MDDVWFTQVSDELTDCLVDAKRCAEACEQVLDELRALGEGPLRRRVLTAIVVPAAVARVLADMVDQPREVVLAACRLCRESADAAVGILESLDASVDGAAAVAALRASSASCQLLIDAAS
jgi:hypothetical protein